LVEQLFVGWQIFVKVQLIATTGFTSHDHEFAGWMTTSWKSNNDTGSEMEVIG
jgi:hypothetical protein